MSEKSDFLKAVTILIDTRENQCGHILSALDSLGVKYERRKLDIGDISFCLPTKDFSLSCVIERKASPDEIYSNITEKSKDNRLEKELQAASKNVNQMILLVEGVGSLDELKSHSVPDEEMKKCPERVRQDIGTLCYAALKAWQCANRYNFRIECVKDKDKTAGRALEEFYYYYHNYKELIAPRK
jgi:ERCC4-type nuclease